jgi:hypothetical protein
MQNNYCDPEFRIIMTTASFTSAECQETQTALTFISELMGRVGAVQDGLVLVM